MVCAAANAVLETFQSTPSLIKDVKTAEKTLRERLRKMIYHNDRQVIDDVRCYGYALAIDFVQPGNGGVPNPELVTKILKSCEVAGLIVLRGGHEGGSLRILPPLTTPLATVLEVLDTVDQHIEQVLNAE